MKSDGLEILEEHHAHVVLLIIKENPGILRSALYEKVEGASRPTAQKRVDEMISAGLVYVKQSPTHTMGQQLFLTDIGQPVADLIFKIRDAISSNKK